MDSTVEAGLGGCIGSLTLDGGSSAPDTMHRSLTDTDDSGASGDMSLGSGTLNLNGRGRTSDGDFQSAGMLQLEGDELVSIAGTVNTRNVTWKYVGNSDTDGDTY